MMRRIFIWAAGDYRSRRSVRHPDAGSSRTYKADNRLAFDSSKVPFDSRAVSECRAVSEGRAALEGMVVLVDTEGTADTGVLGVKEGKAD